MAPVDAELQPMGWIPGFVSVLPHCCGSAWQLLDLIPACGLTSQPALGPASSPQSCLVLWALGWVCPPPAGLSCLPCLGTVELVSRAMESPLAHVLLASSPGLSAP